MGELCLRGLWHRLMKRVRTVRAVQKKRETSVDSVALVTLLAMVTYRQGFDCDGMFSGEHESDGM